MISAVNPESRLDPNRLKYITENFNRLQGLSAVACGVGLAIWQMADTYWKGRSWTYLGALAMTGSALAQLYLPHYYRERFGRVQQRPSPAPVAPGWIANASDIKLILVVSLSVMFLLAIWVIVDIVQHVLHTQLLSTPLLLWLIVLGLALGFRQRVGWLKLYWILAMTLASAFATFYPVGHPMYGADLLLWRMLNACSLGLFLVVWGLYNHIKLLRLMPTRVAEDDHE